VSFLWLACASWLLLDFEPATSAWVRDSDTCALCAREVETLDHLLLGCVHSRETWFRVLRYYDLEHLTPQAELPNFDWWLGVRKRVHKSQCKGFDSLALLVVWSLWKKPVCS
jgi:hypothetical protein